MKIDFYSDETPEFLNEFAQTKAMERLKNVGMHCGCEYTNFERFKNLKPYSRYDHSLGAAKIVWNFTHDKAQTLATLFHDIATPVFAHTIDFLNGDSLTQESTELLTEDFIKNDSKIMELLEKHNLKIEDVNDYHKYPICDNNSPKLSSDRLEYTINNIVNFGFEDLKTVKKYYENLEVGQLPDGETEIIFKNADEAIGFAENALKCSKIYVSDEDRFSMQILSEIIDIALKKNVLTLDDLYITEPEVIAKLEASEETKNEWRYFRRFSKIVKDDSVPLSRRRTIFAKKRYIDPFIKGVGRLSEQNNPFRPDLFEFIQSSQDYWISAEID